MPEIKRIESGKWLCLDGRGSLAEVRERFQALDRFVTDGRVPVRSERVVYIYDDPASEGREALQFSASRELAGDANGDSEVTVIVQPATRVAWTEYRGAFGTAGQTYRELVSWAAERGFRPNGPAREVLRGSESLDANEYTAELQIPVERTDAGIKTD